MAAPAGVAEMMSEVVKPAIEKHRFDSGNAGGVVGSGRTRRERIMKEHFGQEYQVISGRPAGFFRESEARLPAKCG